jgi:hypothetical protein
MLYFDAYISSKVSKTKDGITGGSNTGCQLDEAMPR